MERSRKIGETGRDGQGILFREVNIYRHSLPSLSRPLLTLFPHPSTKYIRHTHSHKQARDSSCTRAAYVLLLPLPASVSLEILVLW